MAQVLRRLATRLLTVIVLHPLYKASSIFAPHFSRWSLDVPLPAFRSMGMTGVIMGGSLRRVATGQAPIKWMRLLLNRFSPVPAWLTGVVGCI